MNDMQSGRTGAGGQRASTTTTTAPHPVSPDDGPHAQRPVRCTRGTQGRHRGDDRPDPVGARRAAHDLLANEGAEALTVRRLAAEAGMSTMNIYSRFGGKDGVLEELYIDGFRRLGEAMRDADSNADPTVDMMACGRAYRTFARTNRTYYEIMFDRTIAGFEPSPTAKEFASATLDILAARLKRAMDAGIIAAQPPRDAAISVWSACHGLVSLELKDVAPPAWTGTPPTNAH